MNRASYIERNRRVATFVRRAKRRARDGVINYGNFPPSMLAGFCHDTVIDGIGVRVIFTRDAGHHTGGWFKNPDYERCWHLSVSFRSPDFDEYLPQIPLLARELAERFFGEKTRWLWVERPFGREGKRLDVWHYRLFADAHWQPLMPRKEVYSKEFTEVGWRSFGEIHGRKPLMTQEA